MRDANERNWQRKVRKADQVAHARALADELSKPKAPTDQPDLPGLAEREVTVD